MMKLTQKNLSALEFDKVLDLLCEHAPTTGAQELARSLTPSDDPVVILRRLRHTTDARRMVDLKGLPSFGCVRDVAGIVDRANKGAILTQRDLLDVCDVLRTTRTLWDYGKINNTLSTSLDEIFDRLLPNRTLEDEITRAIPSEDTVADEASPALAAIRRSLRQTNTKIREILQKYISGGSHAKYLQDNLVTTRDGRFVVPVKAECRADVPGLIHDTSASGATLFIEPMPVVDANNELRVLHAKEEHEIERILAELSTHVSDSGSSLSLNYRNVTELAFIFACGELSASMHGIAPQLNDERRIELHRARHPLISRDTVVPIDVTVGTDGDGEGYDTLIITGPNTGGKTVTLKTLGLFALMVQSGLHIPADEPSSLCIFDRVLVDIGDEQSIEQSLSTFSSHMVNIVSILRDTGDRSLVLFDELGGGTDPIEGAALAVSIIDSVRKAGAMCAATTHYAELKAYALSTPGVCNASCEFDVETLRPTYKLIIGTPGKSNAFAISEKLGLPASIVQAAKEHISSDNIRFEDVIEQLEQNRIAMEKEREKATKLREEYEAFKKTAEAEIQKKLLEAQNELEKAQGKARTMLSGAKASSDFILEQADKVRRAQETANLAKQLEESRRAVRAAMKESETLTRLDIPVENEAYTLPRPLKVGDAVFLVDIRKEATVEKLPDKNDNVAVRAGILSIRTKLSNLRLAEDVLHAKEKPQKKPSQEHREMVTNAFSPEIDLRGMNGEEAWCVVDRYLDDAMMAGIRQVFLIHGKGTGALRNCLWRFLRTDKRLASFRLGQYGEGDGGVTVVELK